MGKIFVIDGTDGSGKQTQFDLLKEHLDKDGIEYKTVSFPNYDSPSSSWNMQLILMRIRKLVS